MNGVTPQAADQLRYARVLEWGTNAGLVVLVILFGIYMPGIIEPHVANERLRALWKLPAVRFLQEAGIADGWGWVAMLHRADILNLVGIVALAFCSVACLVAVMPLYWAAGQRMLFAICALEVLVLLSAATGLIGGGH